MIGPVPVRVKPVAEADIDGHRAWYLSAPVNRPDLLVRYDAALIRALAAIGRNPEAFAADASGTRHVRLGDVPYAAYFKLEAGEAIVIAVMHERQNPATWQSRV